MQENSRCNVISDIVIYLLCIYKKPVFVLSLSLSFGIERIAALIPFA